MTKLYSFLIIFLMSFKASGQWNVNTAINKPICNANQYQSDIAMIKDGRGGFIVVWTDRRNGSNREIYAQRVNASGIDLWSNNGIVICNSPGDHYLPGLTTDENGGAIIAWADKRSGSNTEIFAQRVDSNGVAQWTNNGVNITNAIMGTATFPILNYNPQLISDGSGGAIISWGDLRNNNPDIYAQRINADGIVQWTTNGVAICTMTGWQRNLALVKDGAGGGYLCWTDTRGGNYDVYLQRVDAYGVPRFTSNGLLICNAANDQFYATVLCDNEGNAIVGWEDARNGLYDIYVQKVDSTGILQWAVNGVLVCGAPGAQYGPFMVNDDAGGAILTWQDSRAGSGSPDIYAQRVSATGTPLWTPNGVIVCNDPLAQTDPVITTDSGADCIIVWGDYRSTTSAQDIYAQKLNADGIPQWAANGVIVSNASGDQIGPNIRGNDRGGIFAVWVDYRNGNPDIYSSAVTNTGLPLSAKLLNFQALALTDEVLLSWVIANEADVNAFCLERSADGLHFKEIQRIPFDQSLRGKYRFTDHDPQPGANFYRLTILNMDGAKTVSNVVLVSINKKRGTELSGISVYPNPAAAGSSVTVTGDKISHIQVFDATGHQLWDKHFQAKDQVSIPLGRWAAGTYLIRANGDRAIRFTAK